ncbi:MAG: hypothetical protein LAT67_03115 [Balneolales bacterium]|nr:hypothetical protein [Balneolales bacterium]
MDSIRKFTIYGPADTLARFGEHLQSATKPQYTFKHVITRSEEAVLAFIYEEHRKLINSSTTVTLLIKQLKDKLEIDFVITGGRMGFRGSSASSDNVEPLVQQVVYDFVLEFCERHGLTIQESKENENSETNAS